MNILNSPFNPDLTISWPVLSHFCLYINAIIGWWLPFKKAWPTEVHIQFISFVSVISLLFQMYYLWSVIPLIFIYHMWPTTDDECWVIYELNIWRKNLKLSVIFFLTQLGFLMVSIMAGPDVIEKDKVYCCPICMYWWILCTSFY